MAKKPTRKPKGKPGKPLAQRLAASPALVKKYQSNPGLRSKYLKGPLEKYLTPAQKQSRATAVRLAQPIAPGSSTTERDLAHEAQAAVGVRYGPQDRALAQQLGVARQTEQDTGSLYDQYRAALQQHSAAVQAFQAGAQQALGATAAGITGLGQQSALQIQQAAAQPGIASAVAAPGDLSGLANQALATRQGVMGTFQGEQALTGAAANNYSDALANVVAPGQKLGALAQARGRTRDTQQKVADLATEKGAFDEQFRSERRQDEFKNQLAMQTLGLNQQKAAVDAAATQARVTQSSPAGVAAASSARASASTAAKYGYTAHQWAMLGPKGRQRAIAKAKPAGRGGTDTVYTSGAFAGRKKSDIAAMSDAERQKIVKDYNAGKGSGSTSATTDKKAFRAKYHVDLQTTTAHNTSRDAAQNAQTAFGQVGKVVKQADGRPHRVTTDDVVATLRDKHVSPLWIRAGLEMARGGLTPGTAARIHKAGYSVAQLGFKMRSGAPRRPRGQRPDTAGNPNV